MTDDTRHLADEAERRYRYEITSAMNTVIRACRHILNTSAYANTWAPPDRGATATQLVSTARYDVLSKLQTAIDQAEAIARIIDASPERPRPRRRSE
ncbi:hypothetical protein [Streptomyces sp. NBC_01803]|uniref:hypothetical protein n=1 Tax=Streptomyces sp. NBC_01803 TaxID=2975946 RepID=UPI002DD895C9|nr:hypothetical protein [Streptomyces sp. NBC_01803]WSA44704.1 hypothetical protein OIE51_11110 [Streptomyces sp. NBC_01803]